MNRIHAAIRPLLAVHTAKVELDVAGEAALHIERGNAVE